MKNIGRESLQSSFRVCARAQDEITTGCLKEKN
jgi:hypothetical protein